MATMFSTREAAARLGWNESTLRRRIDRAINDLNDARHFLIDQNGNVTNMRWPDWFVYGIGERFGRGTIQVRIPAEIKTLVQVGPDDEREAAAGRMIERAHDELDRLRQQRDDLERRLIEAECIIDSLEPPADMIVELRNAEHRERRAERRAVIARTVAFAGWAAAAMFLAFAVIGGAGC